MAKATLDSIKSMTTRIEACERDIALAEAELGMLKHIDDDAQRDALVSDHAEDRHVARMTASDVRRLQRHTDKLRSERSKLVKKRARAIEKLATR